MDVAVIGSIAYDYLMRFPGKFEEHFIPDKLDRISVSFLVDEMTKHWGGVAANIAYNLALLRQSPRPKLVGTVGKDFSDYRAWLESAGVDTSAVRQIDEVFTASFFVNTDSVNNQIASFYTGAMAYARDFSLSDLLPTPPDLAVISPNDPVAMGQYVDECHESGISFIYDPSQQVARLDGNTLRHGIERCHMLICNDYEFEIILQKTRLDRNDVVDQVPVLVVTLGEQGAYFFTEGCLIETPSFPPQHIADPTGVGDAFRGGLIRGMTAGWSWELCGKVGALCATYALEHVGTQNHTYTMDEFVSRFHTVFDDDGALDSLLALD